MERTATRGKKNASTRRKPNPELFQERMTKRGHNFTLLEEELPDNFWGNKFQSLVNHSNDGNPIWLQLYYDVFESLKLQSLKNLYRYLALHLEDSPFQYKNIERIFNLEKAKNKFMEDMETYVDNYDYKKMLVEYENYFLPAC